MHYAEWERRGITACSIFKSCFLVDLTFARYPSILGIQFA